MQEDAQLGGAQRGGSGGGGGGDRSDFQGLRLDLLGRPVLPRVGERARVRRLVVRALLLE